MAKLGEGWAPTRFVLRGAEQTVSGSCKSFARFRRTRAASLAAALLLLCMAAAPGRCAENEATQQSSPWWSLWSWIDELFGLSLGGVTYGSGGADRVVGSDQLVHQVRPISGVSGIELRGPIELVIKQGTVESLTLHTDDNIAPLIETNVDNGLLHIGVRPGASFRTRHAIGTTVELVRLGALQILGPGDVNCDELDTDRIEISMGGAGEVRVESLHAAAVAVRLQGSGTVHLAGSAARQDYVVEGAGDIDAEELAGRAVVVRIAGSGKAKIWATQSLSVDIAGSGDVHYRGQPALTTSVHGTGKLIHQ